MIADVSNSNVLRFGPFELALSTGELRRDGLPVKIQPQPVKVLGILASRPGELVTREQIQREVWSADTFVDFEHGVNFCIKEIRAALGDNARSPRYVETLPRRGYRFVAAVEIAAENKVQPEERPVADVDGPTRGEDPPVNALVPQAPEPVARGNGRSRPSAARRSGFLLLIAVVLAGGGWVVQRSRSADGRPGLGSESLASDAYLKGRYLWSKGTADDVAKSLEYFTQATEIDPEYAPGYAGQADAYRLLAMYGKLSTGDASEKSKASALKALDLDPSLAEARVSLGTILFRYEWDWVGAEREYRRAILDRPDYALGHHDFAWFLVAMGRFDEAVAEIGLARDLDPLSPLANTDVGWIYLHARRYDEAIAQIERTLELDPAFAPANGCLELAYVYKGMYAEARAVARRTLETSGADPEVLSRVDGSGPVEGLRQAWQWKLDRRIEAARVKLTRPYPFAAMYAALGDRDKSFEWLECAFAERDPLLVSVNVDPAFDSLRGDARFADLLRRIGLGA